MRIKILGRWWRLVFDRQTKIGLCDPPCKRGKTIAVRSTLRGQKRLEILLHEMTHAAFWHLDEEYVDEFAHDVARVLWRIGYRDEME